MDLYVIEMFGMPENNSDHIWHFLSVSSAPVCEVHLHTGEERLIELHQHSSQVMVSWWNECR